MREWRGNLTSGNYLYIHLIVQSGVELWAWGAEVSALCACSNLRRASRAVTQLYDEALSPLRLRATQFNMLVPIYLWGEASMGDLAQVAQMDPTTLTRNLAGLDRLGLVRISRGPDRRSRVVRLSRRGIATLKRALPLWQEIQDALIAEVGDGAWRQMLPQLSNVTEAAQNLIEQLDPKKEVNNAGV